MSVKYYTLDKIKKYNADFNIIFGGRSDGKTTAVLCEIVKNYVRTGRRGQYVRQLREDFNGGRASAVMDSLTRAGENKDVNLIHECSNGAFDSVKYVRRAWYLGSEYLDSKGEVKVAWEDEPFCYARSISETGRDKSATPTAVGIIHIDEFIPLNGRYLPNELSLVFNMISTTARSSGDVKVYLTANTTTWNSPYFEYFGVSNEVQKMVPGDTRIFETVSGETKSVLALEYTVTAVDSSNTKPSDKFFIWGDNSNSRMITTGEFAVPDYPKCPHHFGSKNVKATFWFVEPDKSVLRLRMMLVDKNLFLFVDKVSKDQHEKLKKDVDLTYHQSEPPLC